MQERFTSRIVLLNDENHLLLLKLLHKEPYLITPGGKIEDGETPIEAARHELYEETGIKDAEYVTPHSWYCEFIFMLRGKETLFKEHFFLARTTSSHITTLYLNKDYSLYCIQ